MAEVIITRSRSGAGNSAWVREILAAPQTAFVRISKREIGTMLGSGADHRLVSALRDNMLLDALEANKSVVVDDAKVSTKDEAHLRKLVGDRASVRVQNVRDGSVAPPVFVDGAPLAIIVDLDGTYALMGDRDPYDASRAEVDALNAVVHSIVQAYKRDPTRQLILCSGRQSEHRGATERWLAKHDIAYDELFMRETGDFRKDTVVKREIFERNIREKYNVEWVLDDRASVVDMWRNELGLVCLQVAEGAF